VRSEAPPAPIDWRVTIRKRALIAAAVFALWTAGIEARLLYLQVFQYQDLSARAARQQSRTITAPAKRGEILDRNGHVLAYSVDADSIYAVPTEIDDADAAAVALCRALEHCTAPEQQTIAGRLKRQRAFAYVRRQVSPEDVQRVSELNLAGVGFLKENRRYYPKKELAAHLLGYVGIDNNGLGGIESAYDGEIRGRAGKILIQTDARRSAFSRVERPSTAGSSLELTIDQYLQHIAERELRAAVAANKAVGGTVIIMDPHTGEILALANEPTFNPNAFARARDEDRSNRAIQDIYEPGSTFKVVTASAALEENVMDPAEPVDVSAGLIRFGPRVIRDVHRYGTLSFTDVIVKSSNVGAIKVGLKLGPERLGRYVRRFGFGQTLSRDFRGESPGIVWDPVRWNDSALASVSMGYQIGVTPLQMAAAVSSVANRGELLEPRAIRAVVRDGKRMEVQKRVIRRTIGPETAAVLTRMMEEVVERGTARTARVDGYSVAGKTGTAAKLVNGRYSKSEYNASFVGFVPSRDPVLTILVVIDTPRARGYYGGVVAAPAFKAVAEAALRHLGIPPTLNAAPPIMVARRDAGEPAHAALSPAMLTPVVQRHVASGRMPELRGLSAREAVRMLARLGVAVELAGDGLVVEQQPRAGEPIDRATSATLWLRRDEVGSLAVGAAP
jgi:cell division protein FtsI (penicillin-binding protein 3)